MTALFDGELTGVYALDPARTRIGFVSRNAMVTKVRGTFNAVTGTAHIDGVDCEESAVVVTIKSASIETGNEKRDSHLRTKDFLDAARHPEITFASTEVVSVGRDRYRMTGDLAIKGITRSVTVLLECRGSATGPKGEVTLDFEGSITISRRDFGVAPSALLDLLVSDSVRLEFEVCAIRVVSRAGRGRP